MAGCATQTGYAGHAGETANLKLTFHLDHSVGANHFCLASALTGHLQAQYIFAFVHDLPYKTLRKPPGGIRRFLPRQAFRKAEDLALATSHLARVLWVLALDLIVAR